MSKVQGLVLTAILLLLGAGCFGYYVSAQRAAGTKHPSAADKSVSEPTVFGEGVISTGDFDSHPAFTPDGKTIYFLRGLGDIYYIDLVTLNIGR